MNNRMFDFYDGDEVVVEKQPKPRSRLEQPRYADLGGVTESTPGVDEQVEETAVIPLEDARQRIDLAQKNGMLIGGAIVLGIGIIYKLIAG